MQHTVVSLMLDFRQATCMTALIDVVMDQFALEAFSFRIIFNPLFVNDR